MVAVVFILALIATVFAPLASSLIDAQRANAELEELRAIYEAITGDPKSNQFGYLGDVGDYPSSLLDLVQSPGLPGWNGPYLNDVRIDSGILYDRFGGALEYFQPAPPAVPASPVDQLALISKGLDRSSTNTASNSNVRANFNGTLPSNSGYASAVSNVDNIAYPAFTDNSSVLSYQSLGQVNFNIRNLDEAANVNGVVPGCPGFYNIVITSVPRSSNEAYMTYNPGGASVDLLQGLYNVQISVAGSPRPILQEQISVRPSVTLTRDYTLPGVNSSLTGTVTLTVVNNTSSFLAVLADGNASGVTAAGGTGAMSVTPCSLMQVLNGINTGNYDYFIMPNLAVTKTYANSPPAMDTLTVTNSGLHNTVAVYDAGLLVGTVTRRGNRRVKSFSLRDGDLITVRDENNVPLETFALAGSITKNY
jgi:hypothetical protein